MNRRLLLLATMACTGLMSAGSLAIAQENSAVPKPTIGTLTSSAYPQVSCTTSDALASADTVQFAADTRDRLGPLLQLGSTWRFPVHIRIITPDDPLAARIKSEASAVLAQGDTMTIEAALPSSDPYAREFIQRQFITAMLWEKFFVKTKSFDDKTRLDVVPAWLVEGLREWVNDDPEHNREKIVKRAVDNKVTPTLQGVTSWHQLSEDRLFGLWQRAFCYYLVDSLIKTDDRRADFQQWLSSFAESGPEASTDKLHFPTETDWERELADASDRSRMLVYSWSETKAELMADETITYAASKDAKVQTCTVDTVADQPRSPALIEALQERVLLLTQLELRSHPGWQPILEAYRLALTALGSENNLEKAKALLAKAHELQVAETEHHQKLLDYINWFEVTNDYGEQTHFQAYFATADEMGRVEADPEHPNPIRASLLDMESKF
jgi:hypothetical protein